jgi:hypothetical protein
MFFKSIKITILLRLSRRINYFKKLLVVELQKSESMCILPWIHTHFAPTGQAFLCCISASYPIGNLNTEKFEKLWNNKKYRHIRKMMLLGRKPKACGACFKNEKINQSSFRKQINKKFEHHFDRVMETKSVNGFFSKRPWVYMDLRFSNLCNFKCRTCDPIHSSMWYADMPESFGGGKPKVIQLFDAKNYPTRQIDESLKLVEEFYFAGGEPLILDEHYKILLRLIEEGRQSKVFLSYSTNLSVIKYKSYDLIEIWKQFESVMVAVSIDAIGELGEYVRFGFKWERLRDNFFKLRESCPHVSLNIVITVSALNVFNLDETLDYLISENWVAGDQYFINILHDPEHLNIQILPEGVKAEVAARLLRLIRFKSEYFSKNDTLLKQIEKVISFMNAENRNYFFTSFIEKTRELDGIRDENSISKIQWLKAYVDN